MCLSVAVAQPTGNGAGKPEKKDFAMFFAQIDTDGNGTLSLEEFKVNYDKRQAFRKARAEKQNPGVEVPAAPTAAEAFAKVDTDADGSISKEEFEASLVKRMKKPEGEKAPAEVKAPAETKAE